ncbi:hypothetical protein [Shewanella sp. GXUN23E]|uniref:hypothetical protein n=1 Tax=Shewanella sp. GXUN23E TaxID=3422498 RepID=UPI003D7DEFD4
MTKASLTKRLQQAATAFRLGQEGRGNGLYREIIDDIQQLIQTSPHQAEYLPLLSRLLQAQQRHDWLDIADTLEYEITALIQHQEECQ